MGTDPLRRNSICLSYRTTSYRAVNIFCLGFKTDMLVMYGEIIAVCSEIHAKLINILCEQGVEFVNVKADGTRSKSCALKGTYQPRAREMTSSHNIHALFHRKAVNIQAKKCQSLTSRTNEALSCSRVYKNLVVL